MHSDSLFAPGDQEPCGTGCCEGTGAVLYCASGLCRSCAVFWAVLCLAVLYCAMIGCADLLLHRQPLPDMGGRVSLLRVSLLRITCLDFALIVNALAVDSALKHPLRVGSEIVAGTI